MSVASQSQSDRWNCPKGKAIRQAKSRDMKGTKFGKKRKARDGGGEDVPYPDNDAVAAEPIADDGSVSDLSDTEMEELFENEPSHVSNPEEESLFELEEVVEQSMLGELTNGSDDEGDDTAGQYDALSGWEERFDSEDEEDEQEEVVIEEEVNRRAHQLEDLDGDIVDLDSDGEDQEAMSVDSEHDLSTVENASKASAVDPQLQQFFQKRHAAFIRRTDVTGLDIIARGMELLRLRREGVLPDDDMLPFHIGSEITKGDWVRRAIAHFTDRDDGSAILQFLKETMPPGIDFPIKEATTGGALKSSLAAYSSPRAHRLYLEIEVCKRGCHVFGERGFNIAQRACPRCNMPRYTEMEGKDVPSETIHYKPLIPLLEELLEHEMFVQAIQHSFVPSFHDGVIGDLLHGKEIKRQLTMMRNNFKRKQHGMPSAIPIDIILAEFWDGAQIHSTVITKFYPVFISLNSLPPSMRGVLGVGTFLLALDTVNTNCTRNFIFQRCLFQELERLAAGHVVVTSGGKIYFLQARMLCHNYDTKAMETMFGVQASTAPAPCPRCGIVKGVYRRSLHKSYFPGHRALLPSDHYLRSLTELGRDLPKGFFEEDRDDFYVPNKTVVKAHLAACQKANCSYPLSLVDYMKLLKVEADQPLNMNPATLRKKMRNMQKYETGKARFEGCFANDSKLIERILVKVNYPHADFREFPKRKVSHNDYLRNAKAVIDLQIAALAEGRSLDSVKAVNGSNGYVFSLTPLSYLDKMLHANFDGFHAVLGFAKIFQLNLSGDRPYSHSHAKKTQCHVKIIKVADDADEPSQILLRARGQSRTKKQADKRVKSKAKWVFPQKLQDKCDAFVESIRIPVGASSHYEVNKLPFARSGMLKGIGKIQLFAFVLPAFMSTSDQNVLEYDDAYRAYIVLVGRVLKKLLSPVFTTESIDDLDPKVVETIALYEGLLPDSESCFLIHEVVDLPGFIEGYGPLRCWWTLYGERAISKIKRFVPKGGKSFQKTTVEKYVLSEEKI